MNGDISFKAKWRVVLKDKEGNIKEKREGFNEMSKAAKIRSGALGSQYLMDNTNDTLGRSIIVGADGIRYNNAGSSGWAQRVLAVLNLGNKQKTESFLPLYNSNGVDESIIGVISSYHDGKTYSYIGNNINTIEKQSLMNKLIGNGTTGFFDSNKANGTIDTVAIMSGIVKGVARYNGFTCWKSITRNFKVGSNNSHTWMLPPGINGLTGDNEILVCCPEGENKVYKINFATGEITNTNYNQTLWGMNSSTYNSLRLSSFIKISSDLVAYDFPRAQRIVRYAADGTPTVVKSDTISTDVSNSGSASGWYMLPGDNNYVYFNYAAPGSSTAYRYKYSLTDFTRSTATTPILNYPSTMDNQYAGNKPIILCHNENRTEYWVCSPYLAEAVKCTDLSNVKGTIIGTLRYNTIFSMFRMLNEDWLFRCGITEINSYNNVQDKLINNSSALDPDNSTTMTSFDYTNFYPYAGFICPDAYSNWYNCFTVDPPITKTSDDTLEVSCWVYPVIT